jgi:hypothetical protein
MLSYGRFSVALQQFQTGTATCGPGPRLPQRIVIGRASSVPIAARILLVSDKTVRAWVEDGLLTPRAVRPRLLLDAERLHTVLRFLGDLPAAGQDRDFRDDLWNRLQDEALLDGPDLAEKTFSGYQCGVGRRRERRCFSASS